jgi:hypothetical protein
MDKSNLSRSRHNYITLLRQYGLVLALFLAAPPVGVSQVDPLMHKLEVEAKKIKSPVQEQSVQLELLRLRALSGISVPRKQVRGLGAGPDIVRTIMENAETAVAQTKQVEGDALIECARNAVNDVTDPNTIAISLHEIAIHLAKLRNWKQAGDIARKIAVTFWRSETFLDIAGMELKAGLRDEALDSILEVNATLEMPLDPSEQSSERAQVGQLQETMGLSPDSKATFEQAIRIALVIPARLSRVEALVEIARKQATGGRQLDDCEAMKEALQQFASEPSEETKSLVAGRIAEPYAQLGDIPSAERYLGLTGRGFYHDVASSELARAYVRNNDFSKAFALLPEIRDEGFQEIVLGDIAERQAAEGNFDDAYRSTRLISREHNRATTFRNVNKLLVTRRSNDGLRAQTLSESEENAYVRFYALVGIAEAIMR